MKFLAMAAVIVFNLIGLACVVWVVVTVLQWTGVL